MVDFRKLFLPLLAVLLVLTASIGTAATAPVVECSAAGDEIVGSAFATRVANVDVTHLQLSEKYAQCAANDVENSQSILFYGDVAGNTNPANNMAINITQSHRTAVMRVVAGAPNRRVNPSCGLIAPPTTADLVARIPPLRI